MRRSNGVFTPQERKAAMWALLTAALLAATGLMVQQYSQPSVGPGGVDAYMTASAPGVLDAQPVMDAAAPLA
ncbi:hypothetical protein [Brevundimonas sp.]|uniref:hypothetical protein n=1 Tax=Brevundimonas sp. TaxID=1871086 RepID=UPI002C5F76B7|nr:hypothetical protein [Brevundimonas sp.]HWQ87833.1 hypothetical protein [Brevundimonas sp.]